MMDGQEMIVTMLVQGYCIFELLYTDVGAKRILNMEHKVL